jgi:hypothetical protein
MYCEKKETQDTHLNTNGKNFMLKITDKKFVFSAASNVAWFYSTMSEILSIEITNDKDDDLEQIFENASNFFDDRSHKGAVKKPSQYEFSIKNFEKEIKSLNKGSLSLFEPFRVENCEKYFKVDFLLCHKEQKYVNQQKYINFYILKYFFI